MPEFLKCFLIILFALLVLGAGVVAVLYFRDMGAASFNQAGLKALTLFPFKFPQQTVALYHTYRDQPDALTVEPLFNVLKLALEWVRGGGE